ncbi:alpha/beta hydrolase [Streptomyces sp. S1D4-14]|nr:alpha/beta hydrolase [Streptomyces sp. S1D4-20]QDN64730.1 alpha/beta hydrolase [Streptomyces sp. S1D4-14]QDO47137.1 alpha/beta hydrolase [Streptomyces sp. RLB3-5]QDO57378.1 alpha/beta hydrolase [Streptomyces sp. RLB1-8]
MTPHATSPADRPGCMVPEHYELVPEALSAEFDDGVIPYMHGGAYVNGSGEAGTYMGLPMAGHARMRAFAVDYRMPPDHPFPVGAVVLATPEADLTESGDSFEINVHVDVVASERLTDSIALYADGHHLRDPYLSPVFGDFGKGFPPTVLSCGTRDLFLSNTVLLHRALRRPGAELHVWEGMPHGGFFGAPEDQELLAEQARFLHKHLVPTETERKVKK